MKMPAGPSEASVGSGGKPVKLTNLSKPFWPELGVTKRDLLRTTPTSRRCCFPTCATARW